MIAALGCWVVEDTGQHHDARCQASVHAGPRAQCKLAAASQDAKMIDDIMGNERA